MIETTRGLDVVHHPDPVQVMLDHRGGELAVRRGQSQELGAGEALRRAAFVHIDMRRFRADRRLVRLRSKRLQRDDVAAGAVEDEKRGRSSSPKCRRISASAWAVCSSPP